MGVVVITGCSSGLGPVAALALARRGHVVYATMRGADRGHDLVQAAHRQGLDVRVVALDVTEDASVQQAIDQILGAEGRIDVLVNNAGVGHFGSVEFLPDDLMRATFETNLFGPVRMLRAVLPTMRSQRSGVVVNVSSVGGRLPSVPIHWSYSASKHALGALSDALSMEVAGFGIRVICIEPGFFRTGIGAKASRPTDGGSPYRALEQAVVGFIEGGVAGGADPESVAAAIVDAVARDDGRVHVLVGEDAESLVGQYQTLTESQMVSLFEDVLGTAAPVVGTP